MEPSSVFLHRTGVATRFVAVRILAKSISSLVNTGRLTWAESKSCVIVITVPVWLLTVDRNFSRARMCYFTVAIVISFLTWKSKATKTILRIAKLPTRGVFLLNSPEFLFSSNFNWFFLTEIQLQKIKICKMLQNNIFWFLNTFLFFNNFSNQFKWVW